MSVSGTNVRNDFVGNGVTVDFAFTFRALVESWVKVTLAGVLQSAGYTVALNADQDASPGGTVTILVDPVVPGGAPPANGVAVGIYRELPLTQDTVLSAYSPFAAKTVEYAIDRTVMMAQQLGALVVGLQVDLADAYAYAAAQLAAGLVNAEVPAGAVDGANLAFTLAFTPIAGSVQLYLNGVRLRPTIDYTISGASISMVMVPQTGDWLNADYRR